MLFPLPLRFRPETGLWTIQLPCRHPYPLLLTGSQPNDVLVRQGATGGHRAAMWGAGPSHSVQLGMATVLPQGNRGYRGLRDGHGALGEAAQSLLRPLEAYLALPQLLLQGPVEAIAHWREVRTAGHYLLLHQVLALGPKVCPGKATGHAVGAPAEGVEEHTAGAQVCWLGLQIALHIVQEAAPVTKGTRGRLL